MLAPVLRLVLSVAAALPDSLAVRADVRLFAEAHYRALDRVLRDAAGVKGVEVSGMGAGRRLLLAAGAYSGTLPSALGRCG